MCLLGWLRFFPAQSLPLVAQPFEGSSQDEDAEGPASHGHRATWLLSLKARPLDLLKAALKWRLGF